MNFQSEADVHRFLEKQESFSNIAQKEITSGGGVRFDENGDIEAAYASTMAQRSRNAKQRLAFADLLAKSLSEHENTEPHDPTSHLEDIFPHDAPSDLFRERFYENPMLCDADEADMPKTDRTQRLKKLASSIGSFVSRINSSPSKEFDGESKEDEDDAFNEMETSIQLSGSNNNLSRPKSRQRSRNSSGKRVSWDENAFVQSHFIPGKNEDQALPRRSLSLNTIMQLIRSASFSRKAEIIRDPGSGLECPDPRSSRSRRLSSFGSRKSSKATDATDESRRVQWRDSKLLRFFNLA